MIPSNPEDQQTIWAIIKERLQLQDDALKGLVVSYIREIGYRIMHYCNLEEIPEALSFTWANMAMAAFKTDQPHLEELDDLMSTNIDMKIGDTSIKESVGGSSGVGSVTMAVQAYASDLNRYRKLRW